MNDYRIEVKRTLAQLGWMRWAATLYGGIHVIDIWYGSTRESALAQAQGYCRTYHGKEERVQ